MPGRVVLCRPAGTRRVRAEISGKDGRVRTHKTRHAGDYYYNHISPMAEQNAEDAAAQALVLKHQHLLRAFRHAATCKAEPGKCIQAGTRCDELKAIYAHVRVCKNEQCQTPQCKTVKGVLSHYYLCKDNLCIMCMGVRSVKTPRGLLMDVQGLSLTLGSLLKQHDLLMMRKDHLSPGDPAFAGLLLSITTNKAAIKDTVEYMHIHTGMALDAMGATGASASSSSSSASAEKRQRTG